MQFVRLNPEHIRRDFDCADSDLNEFFAQDSILFTKQLLAVSYVLEDEERTIAFFSLINDKIGIKEHNSFIFKIKSKMPDRKQLSNYPAVKLARIGVHKDFQSKGYGKMIVDYLKLSFTQGNKTGCRFISVDAYNNSRAIRFYQNNGFNFLTEKDASKQTRHMYFDLIQVV